MIALSLVSSLIVLALIDSTSFGTLLIPVWLLATPKRIYMRRFLIYLATVVAFYFAVGLLMILGATAFINYFGDLLETNGFLILLLIIGISLIMIAEIKGTKAAIAKANERVEKGEGRIVQWRKRLMGDEATSKSYLVMLVGLALTAGIIELGTMLPYIAAIGLITSQGFALPFSVLLLLGYCLFMILPAIVLLVGRLVAYRLVEGLLLKLENWLTKNAYMTTIWVVEIVGILLTVNMLNKLFFNN